jgi:D-glutamate cyclase
MQPADRAKLAALEGAAATGAARNALALAPYSAGHLANLGANLLATPAPCIALLSGFVIPHAAAPAAETDGPLGAALLAQFFAALGWRVVGLSDAPCAPVMQAAFGVARIAAEDQYFAAVGPQAPPISTVQAWLQAKGVTHLLAIERPGRASDGRAYSMHGRDISDHVYPFDPLFRTPMCTTIGIGDGGNEIGMGVVSRAAIAAAIAHGETIACTTPAHFLVVSGVSNWGADSLAAALCVLAPTALPAYRSAFSDDVMAACLDALLMAGAVDGVTAQPDRSVDGLALAVHTAKHHAFEAILAQS